MLPIVERTWQDVRYGVRLLAATPGFTSIAVLSLAIGIGANCATFSFADALLLRPMPVARPGEVFTVGSTRVPPRCRVAVLHCAEVAPPGHRVRPRLTKKAAAVGLTNS